MASVMHTPSHSRFDSSFRGSITRADAPSMVDTLPSISFGFDDLRDQMARFTARFDDFIERGRKRVLEERNQFRMNMAEVQESQRARKRELEDISNQSVAHQNMLAKEAQEQDEMHETIDELKAQRQEHLIHRDDLRAQIADVQKAIQVRRHAQQQHQRQLDDQARHNAPELNFWESNLCMRIEGAGDADQLKFIYTHVDERDWERECAFDLDMSRREYEIVATEPRLEDEAVDAVLERLNETRELASFLKAMRSLFADAVKS
ncbi:hypothetical protein MBLNU459_g1430t1 [Dothideomycetes sp. NU459]